MRRVAAGKRLVSRPPPPGTSGLIKGEVRPGRYDLDFGVDGVCGDVVCQITPGRPKVCSAWRTVASRLAGESESRQRGVKHLQSIKTRSALTWLVSATWRWMMKRKGAEGAFLELQIYVPPSLSNLYCYNQ